MKFSQYLTEASGSVWVLGVDDGSDPSFTDTVENVLVFSSETKLVDHLKDVMKDELTDYFVDKVDGKRALVATEIKNIKSLEDIQDLIDSDDLFKDYQEAFLWFQTKIDKN